MKDMLGREIKVGDTVVCIAIDYSLATGGRSGGRYLKTHAVEGVADFAIKLKGGLVLDEPHEVAVVEMNRNVWDSADNWKPDTYQNGA